MTTSQDTLLYLVAMPLYAEQVSENDDWDEWLEASGAFVFDVFDPYRDAAEDINKYVAALRDKAKPDGFSIHVWAAISVKVLIPEFHDWLESR